MQGCLSAVGKGSTSVSSQEVNMAETTPVAEEPTRNSFHQIFSITEDDTAGNEEISIRRNYHSVFFRG